MSRKEKSIRILLNSGVAVKATVLDGLVIDDIVTQGMRAEGYRVLTGRDVFPAVGRDIKDYLIKTGIILD